jgi:hypothetical protein
LETGAIDGGRLCDTTASGWRFDRRHARDNLLFRLIRKTRMLRRNVRPTIASCNSNLQCRLNKPRDMSGKPGKLELDWPH